MWTGQTRKKPVGKAKKLGFCATSRARGSPLRVHLLGRVYKLKTGLRITHDPASNPASLWAHMEAGHEGGGCYRIRWGRGTGQFKEDGDRLRMVFRELARQQCRVWAVARGRESRRGRKWGEGRGQGRGRR